MKHIVILGNGISGITAARHIRKNSDHRITVISGETSYFFSRTALMYVYMGHLTFEHTQPYENHFWQKNRIDLKKAWVSKADFDSRKLYFEEGGSMDYDTLIIATGSQPNKFGWPGQDLKGVQGLYSKQDLDNLEIYAPNKEVCKRAVIVGGGLIGIELAEMLRSRDIPVTYLVRESSFWGNILPAGESQLINQHIREHHIDLRLQTEMDYIEDDGSGHCAAVLTKEGERIPCNLVGLTAGVSPNITLFKDTPLETGRGVLVNAFLETNIPNVYAIGDCAQQREPIGLRPPVEAVWYTGRMMGEVVAQTICGNHTAYHPGHWFNSAKFLDIEYQTYGWVFAKPKAYEEQFYWQHPSEKLAMRFSYHKETREFLGVNTFGIRLNHMWFDHCLTQKLSVDQVISKLNQAVFDPEFFTSHVTAIQSAFSNHLTIA